MIRNVRLLLFVPLLLAVVAIGCKGSSKATVSGKVTYNDQPVTGGYVRFYLVGTQESFSATILEDGTYTTSEPPAGEMTVVVDTEAINPDPPNKPKGVTYNQPGQKDQASANDQNAMLDMMKKMGRAPEDAGAKKGKYMPIPKKYASKTDTPLKTTLKVGKQVFDIPLTD